MNKLSKVVSILLLITAGFSKAQSLDSQFEKIAGNFVNEYFQFRPQEAVYLGLHQYDGQLGDRSMASINDELKRLKSYENQLEMIDPSKLNGKNFIDYKILLNAVKKEIFGFEVLDRYRKNPMTYAGVIDVNIYIARDFKPIEDRIRSIIEIEKSAPKVLTEAKVNLYEVLPKPFVETAISIAKGSADFLSKDLIIALKDVKDEKLMNEFNEVNGSAIKELNNFAAYLEKEKLPKTDNDYAIGCNNFTRMLKDGELIDHSPDEILRFGMERLKNEQQLFEQTAKLIDPNKPAVQVFKEIQNDHPTEESLIPDTRKNMEEIRQFLIDHNIVTLPTDVRALVEETPKYARATSFASMDTPGPFEKSTQAYYYVTPVDPTWSDKEKNEWLTAFNYYTTDVVSMHEAYPGHYVQYLHVNSSPASVIQKIFGSYAFSEGWAHYAEQMMIEEGFAKDKGELAAAKYHLAQLDESLLRYCRLCVSIMMHCKGMSVDEATRFFMDNCYYEENPSRSEAMRGTYDPGYLYYTLGKLMFYKLRRDYQEQEGDNYSLRKFHDTILDYGSPPIPLLRQIILKEDNSKSEIF